MLDYRAAGEQGVLINFGKEINEEIFQRVLSFEKTLEKNPIPAIKETIKGLCTLFISYDPLKIDFPALMDHLKRTEQELPKERLSPLEKKIIEIPALYGGKYGPDLPLVAKLLSISEDEVINLHSAQEYLVYITGHIGGTAFFKGIGKLFDLPRKKTPVISYPAGSILLADGMGVVFKAADGPTAWYGIGHCPLRQWYPERNPPVLIKPGNWVRYRRVGEGDFRKIKREVEQNTFQLKYLE